MKRFLAALLYLVMVMSLLPMSALAESEGTLVTDLNLTIDEPVIGETLKFIEGLPEGANYTITAQEWCDPGNEESYAADAIYKYREPYRYDLVFKANDGFYFDEAVNYTIEGVEWYDVEYYVDDDMLYLFCYWNDDNNADAVVETVKINLSGYNTKVGQYVTLKADSFEGDPRFYFVNEYWYEVGNYEYYDGKFESGKQYSYSLEFYNNDDFRFADDSEIIIDGIEFDEASCTIDYNFYLGIQELHFTGLYTPVEADEEPVEEPSEPQTEAPESEPQTQAPELETQAPAQPESSSAAPAVVPETGDGNPVGMLVLLLGMSAVGVLAVASRKRRA
ncbi:MAG: hypothetical protein IJM37_11930 [Lachnospiraceae bacterium]|nr:hypothetical protein [Lachnospiraceae bacterium]